MDDLDTLVRTVYGEARGEPTDGQQAVASVILNRARQLGQPVSAVVQAPGQFESWSSPSTSRAMASLSATSPAYQSIKAAIQPILDGTVPDPTGGADHFYAPTLQAADGRNKPSWDNGTGQTIGNHVFLKVGDQGETDDDILSKSGLVGAAGDEADILDKSGLSSRAAAKNKDIDAQVAALMNPDAAPAASPGSPTDIMTHSQYLAAQQEAMKPENGGAVVDPKTGTKAPYIDPMSKEVFTGWGTSPDGKVVPNYGKPATPKDAADNAGSGIAQGVYDPVGYAARGMQHLESDIPALRSMDIGFNKLTGRPTADQVAQQYARDNALYNLTSGNTFAGQAGRLGGNIAMTAPVLTAGGLGVGAGLEAAGAPGAAAFVGGTAGGNLLTRGASLATNGALTGAAGATMLGQNPLTGAETGAALGPVGGALGAGANKLIGAIAPTADPAIATLAQKAADMGIPIRGSQISATPAVRTLDSVLARMPGSGIAADNASQRTAFTKAVGNTFGADSESLTPQVMSDAKQAISKVYNDVASRNSLNLGPQAGGTFMQDAQNVIQASNLGPQNAGRVDNLLNEIQAKIGPNGTMSGQDFKTLTSKGSMLDKATKSPDSEYAGVAKDLKNGLNQELASVASPEDQAALSKANWQWKNMRTVEKLIANSPDNQINPALLQRPVSSSFTNRAYTGAGDLGDLGDVGQRFLKDQGSSNTAERGATLNGLMNVAKYGVGGAALALGGHLGGMTLGDIGEAAGAGAGLLTASKVAGAALRSPAYRNKLISAALNSGSAIPSNVSNYYLPTASIIGNRLVQGSGVGSQR